MQAISFTYILIYYINFFTNGWGLIFNHFYWITDNLFIFKTVMILTATAVEQSELKERKKMLPFREAEQNPMPDSV